MRRSGGTDGVQSRGGVVVVVVVGTVVVVVDGSALVVGGSTAAVVGARVPVVSDASVAVEGVDVAGASSSETAVLEQESKTSRQTATGRNGRRTATIPITGRETRT
ncbi:MAG: hypothetical protein OXS29_10060 [bacterium]|nr:hypothetical protein [bacterium]MDE0437277.1 hypothetical protein [bacterium]